jgi:DNA-directed RNA polymerase specialized sigma24 family protein
MEPSDAETVPQPSESTAPAMGWSNLLAAYRAEPTEKWSGLLIECLGPWLTNARKNLVQVPPFLDDEDIAQQLLVEVLHTASRWDHHCEDCWIPRRLVEAAERSVEERLRRERSSLGAELDEELPGAVSAEPDLLFDTPIGKATADDLRVIYRVKVLKEPVADLARRAGISPRQMRRRVAAARKRARTPVPMGDDQA